MLKQKEKRRLLLLLDAISEDLVFLKQYFEEQQTRKKGFKPLRNEPNKGR